MAQKSSREGLRKELVDYLGNIIICGKFKTDLLNLGNIIYPSKQSFNNLADSLASEIEARTTSDDMFNHDIDEINIDVKALQSKTRINYLRPKLQTTTLNGVTCTNNGDGTYTLNGTASDTSVFIVANNLTVKTTYNFKIVGCPSGGGSDKYKLDLSGLNVFGYEDYGNGETGYATANNNSVVCRIVVYSGTTVNNIVFKPMVTDDLEATYDDFVSYDDSLVTGSSQYFFGGIDTSNVLAGSISSYTATEDCYVRLSGSPSDNVAELIIDGVNVGRFYSNNAWSIYFTFPLKKGQTATTNYGLTIYGIKR